jgi:LAO/AO transport system kinase
VISDILKGLKRQEHKYIAQAISIVENNTPLNNRLLSDLKISPMKSIKIGITGPPGAGKSSITNQLIKKYRAEDKSVCALLVDPSSPFTKGAVLGDRIRMRDFYNDNKVFIRSIASRGSKGGLAKNIHYISDIVESAGFDIIIYETVGVGQVELDVVDSVDTTIVVLVPESGDDIQVMKAGLIEIADIYVINKYDRKDSDKLFLTLTNMLQLADKDKWIPKIVKTVAINDIGIDNLKDELAIHKEHLIQSNKGLEKYNDRLVKKIENRLISDFENSFWNKKRYEILNREIEKDVNDRLDIDSIIDKIKDI